MKADELGKLLLGCGYRLSEVRKEVCLGRSAVECTWFRDKNDSEACIKFVVSEETGEVLESLEALRKHDQLMSVMIDTLPDRFFIVDAENYTIKIANSASQVGDLSASPTCHSHFYGHGRPCSEYGYSCPVEGVKKKKCRITLEHALRDQGGSYVYREVHASPIFDCEGNVVQASIYSIDITQSRHSTRSLAESERLNGLVLDSLPHPAMLIRKDKTILAANKSALEFGARVGEECVRCFGQSAHNLEGCPQDTEGKDAGLDPHDRRCPFCLADRVFELGKALSKDGVRAFQRIWDVRWTPIGKNLCLHYWIDITERKRAEELLVQNERIKALGEMALGVAHNFNNALQVIVGGARLGLLEGEAGNPREVHACLQKILSISLVAAGTLKGLIDFGKPPQESFLPTANVFDLSKTVAAAAMLCDSFWKNGRDETIRTTLDLDLADDCLIRGNETEMFEVVVNMIKNSVEALPNGGNIRIKTYLQDEKVNMEVVDNGVGIPGDHLPRLFEPFWTTKGLQGTGMGLAACHGIVCRHGGQITVQSKPGEETTFRVQLPWEQEHSSPPAAEAPQARDLRLRILLVDDEKDVALLLKDSLALYGQTVFTAFSGRESLDILSRTQVDVVICDLAMKEMNGWEVSRRVRTLCRTKGGSCPLFVLLTGWSEEAISGKSAEESGVDGIVRKPIDASTLLEKIGDLIQKRSAIPTD